jgi:hypothetical protein
MVVRLTSSRRIDHLEALVVDPVATNPELYSVAFENDRVRVLRYHDHPGDRTRAHMHPDSVMITTTAFDRRLRHGDHSVDVTIPAGEVRWLDAQEHSGENIGTTDTLTFFVELKEPTSARDSVRDPIGPRS